MQSPAAYTLPVKLLTSTNDFLMIGPSIPQSFFTHKPSSLHAHTHTWRTLLAFAPTHIHNDFYQGKYMWFNGSLQMPFPLTLLYLSFNKMRLFSPVSLIFQRNNKPCMNTPNDDVSKVRGAKIPTEPAQKWSPRFSHAVFQTDNGSL